MARIVDHLPLEELAARYRAALEATEARHYQAIWLLAQGRTFLVVAQVLAFIALGGGTGGALQRPWPCGAR